MRRPPTAAHPPQQAVILAGGRGTRLLPLTADKPKPMVAFHGRPFLEYLIAQLRDQGITRVLLLLGYLPDVVMAHFGDGSRFGVEITYQVSHVDDDTGRRLWLACDAIDPEFLLLYCDNYWPMNLAHLWENYVRQGRQAQVVVYRNRDGYTRSNLRIDADDRITLYDKSRKASGLEGVDIGFLLMRREVLDRLPADCNCSFEAEIYPQLVVEGELGAFQTDHRYYSVGSVERLPATDEFLARRPTIFLDRDGTLNKRMPPAQYVTTADEWEWLPGALEALRLLHEAGWRVLVVTNQPGIGRGVLTPSDLDGIHAQMRAEAAAAGGRIDGIYMCPHGWNDGCDCRKPAPGMLLQAQRELHLDLSRTPLIGDDERDGQAAMAAGCPFLVLAPGQSVLEPVRILLAQGSLVADAGSPQVPWRSHT